MSIKVYYTAAEAYDENKDLLFKIESFDEAAFTVEIKTLLNKDNLDIIDAIKKTIIEMDN